MRAGHWERRYDGMMQEYKHPLQEGSAVRRDGDSLILSRWMGPNAAHGGNGREIEREG